MSIRDSSGPVEIDLREDDVEVRTPVTSVQPAAAKAAMTGTAVVPPVAPTSAMAVLAAEARIQPAFGLAIRGTAAADVDDSDDEDSSSGFDSAEIVAALASSSPAEMSPPAEAQTPEDPPAAKRQKAEESTGVPPRTAIAASAPPPSNSAAPEVAKAPPLSKPVAETKQRGAAAEAKPAVAKTTAPVAEAKQAAVGSEEKPTTRMKAPPSKPAAAPVKAQAAERKQADVGGQEKPTIVGTKAPAVQPAVAAAKSRAPGVQLAAATGKPLPQAISSVTAQAHGAGGTSVPASAGSTPAASSAGQQRTEARSRSRDGKVHPKKHEKKLKKEEKGERKRRPSSEGSNDDARNKRKKHSKASPAVSKSSKDAPSAGAAAPTHTSTNAAPPAAAALAAATATSGAAAPAASPPPAPGAPAATAAAAAAGAAAASKGSTRAGVLAMRPVQLSKKTSGIGVAKDVAKNMADIFELRDSKDTPQAAGLAVAKVSKDVKDAKDVKEAKDVQDAKDVKDSKDAMDGKDGKDGKERKDGRDGKEHKHSKRTKESKDGKEPKEHKASKESKEKKDTKEPKETKDSKDSKDSKAAAAAPAPVAKANEVPRPKGLSGLGDIAALQKRIADERNKLRLFVIKAKQDWAENEEKRRSGGVAAHGQTNDQEYYIASTGEVFGPAKEFRCEGSIGKGVFSSVFQCRKTAEDKSYAVKFVRSNHMFRKAAEKEVEMYRRLKKEAPRQDHEASQYMMFLVACETFVHQGHLAMVFELEKCDLRTALSKYGQGRGLPAQTVAQYTRQIFLALRVLRALKVIHGDLKPDNILMSLSKTEVRVCDFGSAMEVAEEVKTAYAQPRYYRAPEIILGNPYDTQIDLWSAGVTAYELCTGKILFTGRTNNSMLRAMLDTCGEFPRRITKSGTYASKHFNSDGDLMHKEADSFTGDPEVLKMRHFQKPPKPILTLVQKVFQDPPPNADRATQERLLPRFADLITKCLRVDPGERFTPDLALMHVFYRKDK
mmetsp:Transcript_45134/g.82628  ORF Transcript_45134/g.82628 Transcript_45134/m.82628 type:complete len:1002 (-) Transcript_45134:97-3102(-)